MALSWGRPVAAGRLRDSVPQRPSGRDSKANWNLQQRASRPREVTSKCMCRWSLEPALPARWEG